MSEFPELTDLDRMRAMLCSLYLYDRETNEFHTVNTSKVRIQTKPAAPETEVFLSATVFRKAQGLSASPEELQGDLEDLKDPSALSVAVCIAAVISNIPGTDAKNWMLSNYLSYLTEEKVNEVVTLLVRSGIQIGRGQAPRDSPLQREQEREAHATTIAILEGLDPSGHE